MSTPNICPRYKLKITYTTKYSEYRSVQGPIQPKNPLSEFGRLQAYGLDTKLIEKEINTVPKWETVIISGYCFVFGDTTAECIYRSILGIDKHNNTRQNIRKRYALLSLQWNPDKHPDKSEYDILIYKTRVFQLIQSAYEGLLQAHDDKD